MKPAELLKAERFPRSSRYNPDWILANVGGGANALWLVEWLTEAVELRPGMRVLDLGCGKAVSSIFLRREFGVEVWAVDLWISASENLRRIHDAGVGDGVFPLHADAHALPFAREFFDAIVSIDSFPYCGTDDRYLGNLLRFLKPGGAIGIAGAGLTREFEDGVPEHLRAWWLPETPDINCLHSAAWWKQHWERSGLLDLRLADTLPDGWKYWLDWHRAVAPDNALEIQALEADQGRWLGYARAVGHRRSDRQINDPVLSLPEHYEPKPLLREDR
jgi:cyclopropane fatty-acyl-phospholipid synthase-like methyltransferase